MWKQKVWTVTLVVRQYMQYSASFRQHQASTSMFTVPCLDLSCADVAIDLLVQLYTSVWNSKFRDTHLWQVHAGSRN